MLQWTRILVPALLVLTALAGCLGTGDVETNDDDELPGDGDGGNGNGNNTGNVTNDPPPTVHDPVVAWTVSISADGGEATEAPFYFERGSTLDVTLDGSTTTVLNSTIDVYAWHVVTPLGRELAQSGPIPTYTFNITNLQTGDFGVYTVTLRALSAAGGLASLSATFVLSMTRSAAFEGTLLGLAPAEAGECAGAPSGEGQPVGEGVFLGTYIMHSLQVAPNVTRFDLTLNYEAGPSTQARIYVFEPDADETDCGAALASSEPGDSPLTMSVDLPPQAIQGTFKFRIQLVGYQIDGWTFDIVATYADPNAAGEEAANEE
jgi:hypothetical protein